MQLSLPLVSPDHGWKLPAPLVIRRVSGDVSMMLHPPTGSWVLFPDEHRDVFSALIDVNERGALQHVADRDPDLLQRLFRHGLAIRDGQAAWSASGTNHADRRTDTLVLKLVGFCNMACVYCYDYSQDSYHSRLPRELGEKAITEAMLRTGGVLNILFHGGEPLLAFDEMVHLVRFAKGRAAGSEVRLKFSVQTNGTRFTDEVADFLVTENFAVGVSLDGPTGLNDRLRVYHSGKGTHDVIVKALGDHPELVARVGALTTITSENVRGLREVALYVKGLGIRRWDTIVFQSAGRGTGCASALSPDTEALIDGYFRLLDCAENGDFTGFEARPILHYLKNVLTYRRESMCLRSGCGAAADMVAIGADGSIHGCDCIKNPDLRLGSLFEQSLDGALESKAAGSIRARSTASLSPCKQCDWRGYCGGTCLGKAGALEAIDEQECRLAKAMFPEIFRRLAGSNALEDYARQFPAGGPQLFPGEY